MKTLSFVNADDRCTILKVDVPNRRVVMISGAFGSRGRTTTKRFTSNNAVRRFAWAVASRKLRAGFVQV